MIIHCNFHSFSSHREFCISIADDFCVQALEVKAEFLSTQKISIAISAKEKKKNCYMPLVLFTLLEAYVTERRFPTRCLLKVSSVHLTKDHALIQGSSLSPPQNAKSSHPWVEQSIPQPLALLS